jgi:hypothetical protein
MYTDIKTILDDAVKNQYAVIAASAVNLELARGLIGAADAEQAPLIILMGQAQMTRHARPEVMVPMIKTLAEETNVPVALILDHGRDWDKITYAFRQGFSSIMIDASAYDMEENIRRTKKIVDLCHVQGVAVEGELGHVGQAATMDGLDASMYTKPEEVIEFLGATHVDSLAIACGTAHGKYPDGYVPQLNFDIIRQVKRVTNVPIALHGTSGAGDENICKAVEAGINKINICTDIFNYCRDFTAKVLEENPRYDYLQMLIDVEEKAKEITRHFIRLSGSVGKASNFKKKNQFAHDIGMLNTGIGE